MTILYLGTIGTTPEMDSLATYALAKLKPSVLMSFYFLDQIKKTNGMEKFEVVKSFGTMLDSGAYTAKSKNKKIDIDKLIEEIKTGKWKEAAALDVIGDPRSSYENALYMKKKGADCFPTFHYGEPWEFLLKYAKDFDKVGLGGLVPVKSKDEREAWLAECFSRIWPKKTHGFGVMGKESLLKFPFHSVDSTSWEAASLRFGFYNFTGGQRLGLNRPKAKAAMGGVDTYLRPEIDHYLRMEREVKSRWAHEFRKQGWV